MHDKDACLPQLPYWTDLTAAEKELVRQNSVIRLYERGQFIHSGANECLGMTLVLEGEIRVYMLSEEGREITLFRLNRGEPCVLSASCVISQITFETQMVAEKDCELLLVNPGTFARLSEQNIYVRCFMYELMSERFSSVMWSLQQILFKGFDRRLAAFLAAEYDRTGLMAVTMTHEQIARHTSSAREVVARMLKRFAAEGLVEVRRGAVVIRDIERLRQLL